MTHYFSIFTWQEFGSKYSSLLPVEEKFSLVWQLRPYQEVHQSKLCDDLVLVDVEPGVHEEVVHLHEGEDHVEDRVDAGEDVPRTAAHRNLEKLGGNFL